MSFTKDKAELAVPNAHSHGYCFTHFNYTDEIEHKLKDFGADYGIYQPEKCPTTGRPHLQGYLYWKNKKRGGAILKAFPGGNWRVAYGHASHNFVYCTKTETSTGEVVEWGTKPMDQATKGETQKEKWKQVLKFARAGNFDAIEEDYPEIIMFHDALCVKHFQKAMGSAVPKIIDGDMPGVWIVGPKGSGKSATARDMALSMYGCEDPFSKPCNNFWWTGYAFQNTVILDDMDPTCADHSYDFKTWIDRYKTNVRIHQGMICINPENFIVTSQYDIATVFAKQGQEVVEAMERRFPKVIRMTEDDGDEIVRKKARIETPADIFGEEA